MTHACIFGVFISKFSYKSEFYLVVIFVVDLGLDIVPYNAVLAFGLAVYL